MTRKRRVKKFLLWIILSVVVLLSAAGLYGYINLNRILTNSLNKTFQSNVISDVYELKFENLEVNILTGSVRIMNVEMYPREKPLQAYPGINSSFRLETKKMYLKNVDLVKLIRDHQLDLKKIELVKPGIDFTITDSILVFFPFNEEPAEKEEKTDKKSIQSYFLHEFSMVDAHFHVANSAKLRDFNIERINLDLKDIFIDRQPGRDVISYKHFDFSVGEMTGRLNNKNLRYIHFNDFKVEIDSLQLDETPDTVIYHFTDITSSIKNLDLQTADSIMHITLKAFDLHYKEQTIEFKDVSFKPNISDAEMQRRFPYRKEHFAGEIGSLKLTGVNFDSLLFARKLFIDNIELDKVSAAIYKDLSKPFPPKHHPLYLGQQFQSIPMPMMIKHIKATRVNLLNTEILPDGQTKGVANINRATIEIDNLTSMPSDDKLTISADAYIENSAHAKLQLKFNYNEPLFSFSGKLDKFNLTDLNGLTNSYTPARISKGMADGISFSGMVNESQSNGTMKFLYHDLVIDFNMEDKAKWKSTVLGFAANTLVNASNPSSPNVPEREVKFEVIRDPRKGYLSMVIKSILNGLKETFLMSKENKKAFKEAKAVAKKEAKEERKSIQ